MCFGHAGEVLYNWRVFPLHLNEPPVLSLQQGDSHTSGQAAVTQHLDDNRHIQQEQAAIPGRALLDEQPEKQRGIRAAYRSNQDQCIAWPADGGLPDGPVVYR